MTRVLWIALGWMAVTLGVVGAFLPLLPTTPFLLLAAFAFSQGSQRMHDWLLNHARLGPPIQQWQQHRAISRRTKYWALLSMVLVFVLAWMVGAPTWALVTQACVLLLVALFITTRKELPDEGH
ncbi:MAG: YbaN family protein [Pseudomonadales bacterium]